MDEPAAPPITLQKEWMTVGAFSAFIVMAYVMAIFYDPVGVEQGKGNVFTIAATLLWWLGHGMWLSMDRRRRGLEMGKWRYAVVFLGPLAIWIYLVLEYRSRAVYLIPLPLAIYIAIGAVTAGILLIAIAVAR
ncbi:MAG TPA: hypothetical protein VNM14_21800 [Planctomycetota bacterium]|jgi:hypothetical protein|nr:hypothetical protein [Planctomycetota bacterium]